ncbi:MAG: alpha/beta hydrolase family protein [Promethearchaeota archaeon]
MDLMILFQVISLIIIGISGFFIAWIIMMKYRKKYHRWGRVLTDNVEISEINIQVSNELEIKAYYYLSRDFTYKPPMPGVLLLPYHVKKYPYFEHYACHFAFQGYPTLYIEMHQKGSRQITRDEWISIFPTLKKTLQDQVAVDGNRIGLVGFGLGGMVALQGAALDQGNEIKAICAGAIPVLPEETIQALSSSNRVTLVHSVDDKVCPFGNFESNRDALKLPVDHYLTYHFGGHMLIAQEPTTAAFFSIKLKNALKPAYRILKDKTREYHAQIKEGLQDAK